MPRVTVLAGGVGGAKMAAGFARALRPGELSVVVNVADDFELHGLQISPDLDTVMYTLAGIADPLTGWGIRDDTHHALDMLGRLGGGIRHGFATDRCRVPPPKRGQLSSAATRAGGHDRR